MFKADFAKCSNFFTIVFLIIFINFCTSAPVSVTENAYTQFVAELNLNKCSIPNQVQLPFDTTKVNNFEYLSSYLEICQKTGQTKRNKEAVVLCKEIFNNIRNISCPTKTALPDISVNLSESVCQDIGALKDSVPKDDKSLLKRLTDGFLCDIMCDSEFEKACQVLLWSFEVQKQIASVASSQEPIQPNLPADGGDTNVDSFKQDNTADVNGQSENSVDPENGEKIAKESKDVNEAVGHNGISEVSEPSKLEDNPVKKSDISLIPSKKGKQEKPVQNDKESFLENQGIPKVESQNSTGISEFTISAKTPTTVTLQRAGVLAPHSKTGVKPLEEMTKVESDDQNAKKQLQSSVIKNDEANAGGELPQGSNTDAITDEQTQGENVNTLTDRPVQDRKDTNTLASGPPQDNSSIPASIPVDGEDTLPANEILDGKLENGDKNSHFLSNNDLPHESANEKSPNDAAFDLHKNEQNPSNNVDQNKLQSTASNDDSVTKKTDSHTTSSQTMKDTTLKQTVQEATRDETSSTRDETKADQPLTDSVSRKVEETQDNTKSNAIADNLITGDGTKNASNQNKPKVAQQTEKFDNTIPDTTGTLIDIDEKPLEKSQELKPIAVNPDGKSVIPSSLTETSTKTTVALEKMEGGGDDPHQPADEEADHYGDLENTGGDEYPGPDYGDGGFGEVSKNKASNPYVPSPITAAKEIINSQDEKPMEFPSRNRFGQDVNDIQMISSFPEQEDSHFFFYFLSIVLIMMAGYLIFHNKQKIIALIVEGRHERNRRSHRVGYKKLETK